MRGGYTPKKVSGFKFELDVSHAVRPSKIPLSYRKLMLAETSKHQRSRIKPRTSVSNPHNLKIDPSKTRAMRSRIIEKIRSRSLAADKAPPPPHIKTSDARQVGSPRGLAETQRKVLTGRALTGKVLAGKVLKLEYILESQDLSIDSEESIRRQASSPIKGIYGS
jgi:hypothetical protein